MDMVLAIIKKILLDLAGTAVIGVAANWALQLVSDALVLVWIIRIAVTVAIVAYLAARVWGVYSEEQDKHGLRKAIIGQVRGSNDSGWVRRVVEASYPHLAIDSPNFPYTPSLRPARRSRSLFVIIGLIVMIVALIIGGMFTYLYLTHANLSLHTAAANPYPTYFQKYGYGLSAIDDPLTQASEPSWQTVANRCRFVEKPYQGYHVSTPARLDLNACYSQKTSFKNFTYEVEMTIIQGHCGGLLFRKGNISSKYYVFQVCKDRTYALLKYVDSTHFQAFFGKSKGNSAITQGLGPMNRIAVVAKGSTMYLLIHDSQVAEITDSSYTEGSIALVASSDMYKDITEVVYRNVKVWVE